jgi:hypothetical protein
MFITNMMHRMLGALDLVAAGADPPCMIRDRAQQNVDFTPTKYATEAAT